MFSRLFKSEFLKLIGRRACAFCFLALLTVIPVAAVVVSGFVYPEDSFSGDSWDRQIENAATPERKAYYLQLKEDGITPDDWRCDALRDSLFPKKYVFVSSDGEITLQPDSAKMMAFYEQNDATGYFYELLRIEREYDRITGSENSTGLPAVKALDFCISNSLWISKTSDVYKMVYSAAELRFTAERERADLFSVYPESTIEGMEKEAAALEYAALHNISAKNGRFYAIARGSLTVSFIPVLVLTAFAASATLPSEYKSRTAGMVYRCPGGRFRIIFAKFLSVLTLAVCETIYIFLIVFLLSAFVTGFREAFSFYAVTLPGGNPGALPAPAYLLVLCMLFTIEATVITLLCMAVSTQFVNPVPAALTGMIAAVVAGISEATASFEMRQPWMKFIFVFSMNFRQFFENDLKIYDMSLLWAVVSTILWTAAFCVIILLREMRRDI